MEKKVPYVNMETVSINGKVTSFKVRTINYLPIDSKITLLGEGDVADNVVYRDLIIEYNGTSEDYDYFTADFTIQRDTVGLLERGVLISTKAITKETAKISMLGGEKTNKGIAVDYQDGGML